MIPKAQTTKAKVTKWDYINLKHFCNQQNEKATYRIGEIFANHTSDKELMSKI